MSGVCLPEPSVSNAKQAYISTDNNSVTAFYECLSGFAMSGNSRISCNRTLDLWESAPSCNVIRADTKIFNTINTVAEEEEVEWWSYFLAAFLSFLALSLFMLVLWCWCWAPRYYVSECRSCCKHRKRNRLRDTGNHRDVFWVESSRKSTPGEVTISRPARAAKDPSKENKIWMPHTHSVRDINTSTK